MLNDFNFLTAALGLAVLMLALAARRLKEGAVPPPLAALLVGIALGPRGFDLIDPGLVADPPLLMEQLARLTLGMGLVEVALALPGGFPRRNWRPMTALLGLGMPAMWLIAAALAYFVAGLPLWPAALVGAILTPTDPVAASAIVRGPLAERRVPAWLRHAISFESGANDGLGYLIVVLPLLMLTLEKGIWRHWLTHTLLWEICGALLVGLLIGGLAGKIYRRAADRDWFAVGWKAAFPAALALFAVGVGKLIHGDEVLVVFATAVVFAHCIGEEKRRSALAAQEGFNRFFAIPFFALLGTALPWDDWFALGWGAVAFALGILFLRRLPVFLLLRPLLPEAGSWRNLLFMGWFGPIAVSAVYYAALAEGRLEGVPVWSWCSLGICASVLGHGLTAAFLTRRLPVPIHEKT